MLLVGYQLETEYKETKRKRGKYRRTNKAMRNYKGKMDKYRLTPERYEVVRDYCLTTKDHGLIKLAISIAAGDIAPWMLKHLTNKEYLYPQMELDSIPCNGDTFRIKRQRVYYTLSRMMESKGL